MLRVIKVNQPPCDYADSAGVRLFSRRRRPDESNKTTAEVESESVAREGRTVEGANCLQVHDYERSTNNCDATDSVVR